MSYKKIITDCSFERKMFLIHKNIHDSLSYIDKIERDGDGFEYDDICYIANILSQCTWNLKLIKENWDENND